MAGTGYDQDRCRQVLEVVYLYLDDELRSTDSPEVSRARIAAHLDECGPCLREYGIEQEVKVLVRRCCGHEQAPESLRQALLGKLRAAGIRG